MIEIDGSKGEGGGQIVRSSLALAAVTGQAVRLTKIRAGRKKSGLMNQHLAAVKAVAEVCDANLVGAEIGAQALTFEPGRIRGGHFEFNVGTAGSATLVAQTVLPALMLADEPSEVVLEGGTHNPWAPPFEFLERTFLPQLANLGPTVIAKLHRHGFFPAGGGKFEMNINPSKQLRGLKLITRSGTIRPRVNAIVSNLPSSIGQRECDTIRGATHWPDECFRVQVIDDPRGPGNVVMIELASDNVTEIFTGFGKRGRRAEVVARNVLDQAQSYQDADVPVGQHLADQLMMPMALAAGQGHTSEYRTTALSQHSKTHLDLLKRFLEIDYVVEQEAENKFHVRFFASTDRDAQQVQ